MSRLVNGVKGAQNYLSYVTPTGCPNNVNLPFVAGSSKESLMHINARYKTTVHKTFYVRSQEEIL